MVLSRTVKIFLNMPTKLQSCWKLFRKDLLYYTNLTMYLKYLHMCPFDFAIEETPENHQLELKDFKEIIQMEVETQIS